MVVRIAIQEFVSTFLGCYFTGVVLMVAFLVAMVALRPDAQRDFPIVFAVVPVFLLAGAAWTTVSGRKAAEGEDAWLLRFLKETLEAEEVPDSPNDSVVP